MPSLIHGYEYEIYQLSTEDIIRKKASSIFCYDGQKIVYVRNFNDIMTDQVCSNIWITNFDGTENHPLTSGKQNDFSPRWSPDGKKYPLILEIHGGPHANYGPRYATEMQLYASHRYLILYTNPRGSTSYGTEFGNLLFKNYPGNDYDGMISGVRHRMPPCIFILQNFLLSFLYKHPTNALTPIRI